MNYRLHEGEIIISDNAQNQSLTIFGLTEGQPATPAIRKSRAPLLSSTCFMTSMTSQSATIRPEKFKRLPSASLQTPGLPTAGQKRRTAP